MTETPESKAPSDWPTLLKSNARHKHIIIISDGDPAPPVAQLMQAARVEIANAQRRIARQTALDTD